MPNSATWREKPMRSVNITAQRSPNSFQITASMAAVSAPGASLSSISRSRRSLGSMGFKCGRTAA
jgi:hypothetical protein